MGRIILIDILRCIAIIAMIIFHFVYDLSVFYNYPIDYEHGFWHFVQVVMAGGLFIFVSGWTASLGQRSWKNLVTIGLCALLVSIVTYYQFGNAYVRFGILHFIFVANLLYILLLERLSSSALSLVAVVIILLTQIVWRVDVEHTYLLWLDITPIGYQSVDHYPLTPWLAVFITGIVWGRSAIATQLSSLIGNFKGIQHIISCSKHSLAIYILHQPVILVLLMIYHTLT